MELSRLQSTPLLQPRNTLAVSDSIFYERLENRLVGWLVRGNIFHIAIQQNILEYYNTTSDYVPMYS